jgi:hypothetical protein
MILTVVDITDEPIDQIISAVNDAIENGTLKGNGGPAKLAAFVDRLEYAKAAIESGDLKAAIKILESIYKQVDGKPSPKDTVVGDAADEIAQMIQDLINSLKYSLTEQAFGRSLLAAGLPMRGSPYQLSLWTRE